MSERQAEARARLRLLDGQCGGALALTASEYLKSWLSSRRALRPSTALAYEIHLRRHLLPALGDVPLSELSPERIDALYRDLLTSGDGPELTVSTVRRIHARAQGCPR